MSQIHSFQSKKDNVDDWLEGKSANAVSGASFDNIDMLQAAQQVEQLDFLPATPVGRPAQKSQVADHYPTISLPVNNEPASFLSALHSTIGPRARREPLVIPGSRKRASGSRRPLSSRPMPGRQKMVRPESHLHPHLRLGIVAALVVITLLLTAITLSPVGNSDSQVDVPIVGGFIQWAQDEQMHVDMTARRDQTPDQGVDTTATTTGPLLPRGQYVAIAQSAAQKYGISSVYFVNQIQLESHFNPYAQSGSGAVGIAQFEPATAAGMGINPYDPNSALDGAARYMSQLQSQFGGDYAKALAAYNGGSGTVQAAVRNCGAGWLSCISPQTRQYINIVMA